MSLGGGRHFPNISRRGLLRAAGLAGGCGFLLSAGFAASAALAQAIKISQKQAHYQSTPKGNAHCAKCVHFLPPKSCAVVQGIISPHGWCTQFAPRP